MSKPEIILIGAGGHCRSCIDVIEQEKRFSVAGIVEKPGADTSVKMFGYPMLGTDENLSALRKDYQYALVTVGQIKTATLRIRLCERLLELGFELPAIVSPLSYVSPRARIGKGTIIMHHALVNGGAIVGDNCIINTKALVEHDAVVENHCHIATGAIINGSTVLGEGSFMGSNAMSQEGMSIGRECIIGGGVSVLKNLEEKTRYIKQKSEFSDKNRVTIMHDKCMIIAEAGVNHNGNLKQAKQLVDAAARAGADAVKFQTFTADNLVCESAPKAKYQTQTTSESESQYEMIKRLELNPEAHRVLIGYCRDQGIEFLSTPFDHKSIDLLDSLGLKMFKIGSGEITNLPYLRKIGTLNKKVILATGMSDLGEVEDALQVLEGAGTSRRNITVLHCNTEYPTPMQEINLRAMQTIATAFPGIKVGYSDHSLGIEAPIAAVALGAKVIEKHFTLDKTIQGPDHKASLEPEELARMVQSIRNIEMAMGSGEKKPSPSEAKNKDIARKSIVATRKVKQGEMFSKENITVKRPGNGISPMRWDELIGKIAARDFRADEPIVL